MTPAVCAARLPATADLVVIGGGLVGAAVAWGAACQGMKVAVLDEGDNGLRASRGNFGLVWIQGKGYGYPAYARWSMLSGQRWPHLAAALLEETGIDVGLKQPGGFHICLTAPDLEARRARLQILRDSLDGDYPYEFLSPADAREVLPGLGPAVTGVTHSPLDGHVNPLKLLRALHAAGQKRGVALCNGEAVQEIKASAGDFRVVTARGTVTAPRLVLAAGLGNRALAGAVGLNAPVMPNRGQVLIAERVGRFLDYPTTHIRQTDEGTVQLGESMEDVGFNDTTTTDVLSAIALRGVKSFPALANVKLVRTWAALRVMSPDGFPIYAESATCPGAFVVTCHSGVTLAAAHAVEIAPWVAGGAAPAGIEAFSDLRFATPQERVA